MAILTGYSGLGGKSPAAFLLEIGGRRLLLDLGEGPEPGIRPDLTGIGHIDAIFLSHGHVDHVGAIDLWDALGRPPVHATPATFDTLPLLGRDLPARARHALPLQGRAEIAGLPVTVGRSGHAIGGIWLHLDHGKGALYMADFSRESLILPFDAPPPAALVVTDISYGDRDQALADQVDELAALARSGAVLPVPVMGRGTEMALRLSRAGLTVALCPVLRAEMQALARDDSGQITDQTGAEIAGCLPALPCISDPADASPDQIIIAADTDRPGDLLPRLMADSDGGWRFIHTGHVAPNSRAETLLRAGRALRCSWNVHPRLRDHVWLAELTAARAMVPAFGALQAAPRLRAALDGLWSHDRVTETTEPPLK